MKVVTTHTSRWDALCLLSPTARTLPAPGCGSRGEALYVKEAVFCQTEDTVGSKIPCLFPVLALKVHVPRTPSPRQTSRAGHPKNTPHLLVGEVAKCRETEHICRESPTSHDQVQARKCTSCTPPDESSCGTSAPGDVSPRRGV